MLESMLAAFVRRWNLLSVLSVMVWIRTSSAYLSIPFNDTFYFGPDGPWQAAVIDIKYSGTDTSARVNLFPGFVASALVPSITACKVSNVTAKSHCGIGGALPPLTPAHKLNVKPLPFHMHNEETGWSVSTATSWASTDIQLSAGNLTNISTNVLEHAYVQEGNGAVVGLETGWIGLGLPQETANVSIVKAAYEKGWVDSDSFSLHSGSAAFNYPGSLVYGGYDRGRAIGPLISYGEIPHNKIDLLDITIGVEEGASPFEFESMNGLLRDVHGGPVSAPVQVAMVPQISFMVLRQSTIDAIIAHIPVSYDLASGFWLWDVDDPQYHRIVSSPAYLGFVFPLNGEAGKNTTIKIPFSLLNLTLERSISRLASDVPYFPVQANAGTDNGDVAYWWPLGRAFLQGVLFGINWRTGPTCWLAQAPGPGRNNEGLGRDIRNIGDLSTTIDVRSGENLFKDSWSGYWTPLPQSKELSDGGIAGVVVGGVVFVTAVVALGTWLLLRRRKRQQAKTAELPADTWNSKHEMHSKHVDSWELAPDAWAKQELSPEERKELPGTTIEPGELPTPANDKTTKESEKSFHGVGEDVRRES